MSTTGSHTDINITMPKSELSAMIDAAVAAAMAAVTAQVAAAVAAGIEKAGLASNKTNKSSSAGTAESNRLSTAHNLWRTHLESGSDAELSEWLQEHYPIGSDGKRGGGQHWYFGIGEVAVNKHSKGKVTNCKLCKIGGHTVEIIVGADTLSKKAFPDKYAAFKDDAALLAKYRASKSGSAATTTTTTTTASNSAAASNSSSSSDSSSTGSSKSSAGIDEGRKTRAIAFLKDKGVDPKELTRLESLPALKVIAFKEEWKELEAKKKLKASTDKLEKQKAATQAKNEAADCHKLRTWHHQRSTVKNGSCLPYEGLDLAALKESKAKYMAPGHKPYSIITKDEAPPMTAPASNSSASNSSASASASVEHEAEEEPVYEREEVDDVAYLVEQGTGRAYEIDEDGTRGAYVGELVVDAEGVLSIETPEGV